MASFPSGLFQTQQPIIQMYIVKGGDGNVYLPMPSSVAVNDGGNYSTIDLGITGSLLEEGIKGVPNQIKQFVSGVANAKVKSIVSGLASGGELGAAAQRATFLQSNKKIVNPNSNTTFTSNSLRTFSFTWVLVPRTPGEAGAIKSIVDTFRKNVYARATVSNSNLILDYPPIWKIEFLRTSYYPKIFDLYLTNVKSTLNASGFAHYTDGAPFETTLSLDFTETRQLIQNDFD